MAVLADALESDRRVSRRSGAQRLEPRTRMHRPLCEGGAVLDAVAGSIFPWRLLGGSHLPFKALFCDP